MCSRSRSRCYLRRMVRVDAAGEDGVPYSVALARSHVFGFLVAVTLPRGKETVGDSVLARLDAREAEVARTLRGFRQVQWVGGRLAAREAGLHLGATSWMVGTGALGEPLPPPGFSLSIAHKRGLAIALVADVDGDELGVDLEDDLAAARAIEAEVFSLEERAAIATLPGPERDDARMLGFALKEAVYKAVSVRLGADLGYDDARFDVGDGRTPSIALLAGAPQAALEVIVEWYGESVIAAVRGERRSRRGSPSSSAR